MKFQKPRLSRRQFIAKTTTMGAALSGGSVLFAQAGRSQASQEEGRKGKMYPDQRRKFTDARSGHTIWQLTNAKRNTTKLYFTNRSVTPDSRWLIYHSDRGGATEKFNLFKMDLRSGESIQLTESGKVLEDTPEISRDGKEVYYMEEGGALRAADLESLKEREVCKFDERFGFGHALTIASDNRHIISAAILEPRKKLGYNFGHYTRRDALIIVRTDNGEQRRLIDGNSPLGHVAYSPTDPNLILFSIHVFWAATQRPWLINADGTGHRPIFLQRQGEGAGHEFWGESGRTVLVSCYGGRQPEGLWAANVDGSNERCVLAGPNIAHGAASPEEDRFVVDELHTDTTSLWYARKGSPTPQFLHKMAADWFAPSPDGTLNTTAFHPHPRFLPNGTGVVFNSAGEIYIAEL